jgi:phosphohistidine phosphatase
VAAPHGSTPRDEDRPLTPEGRAKMRKAAAGLLNTQPAFSRIATSPLKRAAQTADIVKQAYAHAGAPTVLKDLAPGGSFEKILAFLKEQPHESDVLLVGHQPSLGRFLSTLVWPGAPVDIPLKKGGVARVDLFFPPTPGPRFTSELRWLLTPKQLRGMARP